MNFYDMIQNLENSGFATIILPFMLIFVIVFAVLQRLHIFGKDETKKKFNIIIALVMAFSVVIPHALGKYPPESDPVLIMNNVLPNISLIMLAVIAFMLIIGVFGARVKIGKSGTLTGLVIIFSALAVVATFGIAANWFGEIPSWLRFLEDEATQTLFITILVMGIIIAFITGSGKDKSKDGVSKKFGDMFKGVLEHSDDD